MDLFTFSSLVTAMMLFSLGVFVFARNPKSPLNQVFLLLILTIFWWAFTEFMMRTATTLPDATFWMKLNAVWTFIPALSLNFMWIFTGRAGKRSDAWIYPFMYLPAILFCTLELATDLINVQPVMGYWGFSYGLAGNLWIFDTEMAWAFGLMLLTLLGCLEYYLTCQDARKKMQAAYIMIGFASPSIVAFVFLVVLPVVSSGAHPFAGIPFPQMFLISSLFFSSFIWYGIWKHDLFVVTLKSASDTIVSTITDMLILLDPDGKISAVNRAACETLQYGDDELIGSPVSRVICDIPDNPGCLAEIASPGHGISDTGMLCRKKDGATIPVSISGSEIRDANGNISGMVIVARDITARKQAEEALHKSEDNFRTLVETSPNIIWACDRAGNFRFISRRITPILGYTPEEVIGRSAMEFVDTVGKAASARALAEFASSGSLPPTLEIRAQHRDGHEVILEIRPSLMNIDGMQAGFRGIAQDITERKKAEEALRVSRQKLAEAMDIANLADWEYDVGRGVFIFNNRFYALFGTTADREGGMEMAPETYAREFIHPDDRHLLPPSIEGALKTADPNFTVQAEHRIIRRDGAIRYIIVRIGVTLDEKGRVIRTHGANQDITERKRAEDALRLANRQLSLLSSITRHDINNKITVIMGYLKLAKKKCTDPVLAAYFVPMESATGDIRSQIEFTRIYQDIGTHELQWIDLDTVMPRAHIPEAISFRPDVQGILVYASPMLERVFFNLLDNTIRYGQNVTEIRVSSRMDGDTLVVIWEDNGIGVAAGEKELIFERGFGKNTGLGMFLVREILTLTDITITETGVPGSGARFEMIVPKGAFRVANGA